MNNNTAQPTGTGSLVVKVSTARGAIPLEGARVNIRGTDGQSSDVIYSLMTNRDGLTELVTLPAPARGLSESPGNPTPYALYDLDIFKEGYIDLTEIGREVAMKVYDRHMLLTELLVSIGVSREAAMADACKIEHCISDESFAAIKKFTEEKK